MATPDPSNRPLSPHLSVYRWELGMTMSIFHRATGMGMALTGILLVWWFLSAAISPSYFAFVDGILTSWVGLVVMTVSLWAFWYHFFNGVRHLRWDYGKNLGVHGANRSGWYVVILSFGFAIGTIWLA